MSLKLYILALVLKLMLFSFCLNNFHYTYLYSGSNKQYQHTLFCHTFDIHIKLLTIVINNNRYQVFIIGQNCNLKQLIIIYTRKKYLRTYLYYRLIDILRRNYLKKIIIISALEHKDKLTLPYQTYDNKIIMFDN